MTRAHNSPESPGHAPTARLVVDSAWSRSWEDVLDALGVAREHGLSRSEAMRRRKGVGRNRLREPHQRVRGIEGLRVVDASVLPGEVTANIHPAVIAVAERAADLMKTSR